MAKRLLSTVFRRSQLLPGPPCPAIGKPQKAPLAPFGTSYTVLRVSAVVERCSAPFGTARGTVLLGLWVQPALLGYAGIDPLDRSRARSDAHTTCGMNLSKGDTHIPQLGYPLRSSGPRMLGWCPFRARVCIGCPRSQGAALGCRLAGFQPADGQPSSPNRAYAPRMDSFRRNEFEA